MATSDDALETYTHLPIHLDPQSKQVSISTSDKKLQDAVSSINSLHNMFKSLDTPNNTPAAPLPVNPKRSAQITKLRETASQNVRKGQIQDAIKLLGLAIDMAAGRPPWEPVGLVREELALTYMERSNAYVLAQNWPQGYKDAECSTECKRGPQQGPNGQKTPGNPRAFTLGGKCLIEMGRWQDAAEWLEKGLEVEGTDGEEGKEMTRLLKVARSTLEKR